jgi:hypothetical protein
MLRIRPGRSPLPLLSSLSFLSSLPCLASRISLLASKWE